MPRLTQQEARDIVRAANIPAGTEFHALDTEQVNKLLEFAGVCKYRQPKNANGSRARYFYAYVKRQANRETV